MIDKLRNTSSSELAQARTSKQQAEQGTAGANTPDVTTTTANRNDSVNLTKDADTIQNLTKQLASEDSVDIERVRSVKAAIAEGRYEIDQENIANQLIDRELKLEN